MNMALCLSVHTLVKSLSLESPRMELIGFLQTQPQDILVTLVFSEYVHVLLNYRALTFLHAGNLHFVFVWVPTRVCTCIHTGTLEGHV